MVLAKQRSSSTPGVHVDRTSNQYLAGDGILGAMALYSVDAIEDARNYRQNFSMFAARRSLNIDTVVSTGKTVRLSRSSWEIPSCTRRNCPHSSSLHLNQAMIKLNCYSTTSRHTRLCVLDVERLHGFVCNGCFPVQLRPTSSTLGEVSRCSAIA